MTQLHATSTNLDNAFSLITSSTAIANDTRGFLENQAIIYANYLTAAYAGRLKESAETQASMTKIIDAFCTLVQQELGQRMEASQ